VSKVTEKIKTRSKPTPSENFSSHPLEHILNMLEENKNLGYPYIFENRIGF
jgi:hypothetical protein